MADSTRRLISCLLVICVSVSIGPTLATAAISPSVPIRQEDDNQPGDEASKNDQSQTSMQTQGNNRQEIEPGVVVFGQPNRFAEVGSSQGFDSSPDGRTLIFASSKIKFFDLIDNKIIAEVGEPQEYFRNIAYSPDGRYVFGFVQLQNKKYIRVIDAITQESVGTITTEVEQTEDTNAYFNLQKIIVSADAKYIGLVSYNDIQVRDVASGELTMHVKELGYIQDAGFSPDETELIIPQSGKLKVYDIESGEEKERKDSKIVNQAGRFMAINYSRNLLALSNSTSITLFDLDEQKKAGVITMPSGAYAQQIYFSDDGSKIAISAYMQNSKDGSQFKIQLADVETKKILKAVPVASQGVTKIVFSIDGKSIFVSGHGIYGAQEVQLDQEELTKTKYPSGPSQFNAIHPNGESFMSCSLGGEVTWYDAKTGDVIRTIQHANATTIDISPDGADVVVASRWGNNKPVVRLNYESAKEEKSYAFKSVGKKSNVFSSIRSFMARGGPTVSSNSQVFPISVKSSIDGEHINALSMEMSFRVVVSIGSQPEQTRDNFLKVVQLEAKTGKKVFLSKSFPIEEFGFGKNEFIQNGAVHPDGSQFIVSRGAKIFVVECESGEIIDEFEANAHANGIDYSPDGKFFYATHHQGVTIWDSESQVEVKSVETTIGNPKVAFSKNGGRVAVCQAGKSTDVSVFNTKTWEVVKTRSKTEANRTSVAFSNDGQKLLMGLADCRLEMWDLALID